VANDAPVTITPHGRPHLEEGPTSHLANYRCRSTSSLHEQMTETEIARRLALLRNARYIGDYAGHTASYGNTYFVCDDTLSIEAARQLGIRDEHDLYGGVVPYPFVATKAISHGLPNPSAVAPHGWSPALAAKIHGLVLEGSTAFSKSDARAAGSELLKRGRVRIKPVQRRGGSGQVVVSDLPELCAALERLSDSETTAFGVVLESNLDQPATRSVGFVDIGTAKISYCGTQALTRNNRGASVYGGSRLFVVRGGADVLFGEVSGQQRLAVEQAMAYEAAVRQSFPGLLISRRNYDILQGRDAGGRWCSGVLEQSWRIGGASTAEVLAFEALQQDASLTRVRVSCAEVYGEGALVPPEASVFFSGFDENVGYITKYAMICA
jgi:hypothetical protein